MTDENITDARQAPTGIIIGAILVSAFLAVLNETIMAVALPRLMIDLDIKAGTAQWLTTSFMLTMAVVIPVTGLLLQRLTTRAAYIAAMSLFCSGTLVAGLASGFPLLLLGRVVQASGTAILMPLLMTTIMQLVPADRRGQVMGNISIVMSVAPAIGPTISGLILSAADWRWLFLSVLPFALISLALGARRIVDVGTRSDTPIDYPSVVISAVGFGSFVYGLSTFGEAASPEVIVSPWVPLLLGAVMIVVFVRRQAILQNEGRAMLDMRTMTVPLFRYAVATMATLMLCMFGVFVILPIYLQTVLGLSTLQTGLLMLPGGLVMGLCAPIAGSAFDKYGAAPVVLPGSILVSIAIFLMTTVAVSTPIWILLGMHFVLSVGMALLFTPLFTLSLGSLPAKLYSHGSAIIGTTQQVAGAAGAAALVALMSSRAGSAIERGVDPQPALVNGIQAAFLCAAVISLLAIGGSLLVCVAQPSKPVQAD